MKTFFAVLGSIVVIPLTILLWAINDYIIQPVYNFIKSTTKGLINGIQSSKIFTKKED